MITFKQFLVDSADPLLTVEFEMAVRLEFKCTQEQAAWLVEWLGGNRDWEDLGQDLRNIVRSYFNREDYFAQHAILSYDNWAMDQLADLLKSSYQLNARELIR